MLMAEEDLVEMQQSFQALNYKQDRPGGRAVAESSWTNLILWSRRVWDGDVQRSPERRHVCEAESVILEAQEEGETQKTRAG